MNNIGRNYTDNKTSKELIGNIGFGEAVFVNCTEKRTVLITGAGSYIGESFLHYAKENYPENYEITTLDLLDSSWRAYDFSAYDTVFHVAGIAHADVGNVSDETKEKYYQVNTDLAVEVAKKAKTDGVRLFLFMSSMIVYGDSAPFGAEKIIDANTVPKPANFYGDSKLQADIAVRALANDAFHVIVLRPPMIFGKGSKGNYPTLAKLAKALPIFPNVENQRSMLFIGNLCELLCQVMLVTTKQTATVLIPQNATWVRTCDLVQEICRANKKHILTLKVLNPFVFLAGKIPGKISGLVHKAFGNSCYDHALSNYEGITYQRYNFKESVGLTEE
ncbi:MAG: NAD-dependent epimerase/dehydratase family protein [bacterium]|nr:NAD-dependent epimerase/dehydratase family protein [bacterium]